MKCTKMNISEVLMIEPDVYSDNRGYFFESFNQEKWKEVTGLDTVFVQDNQSYSVQNVLRGLHYQKYYQQDKLIRVVKGAIYDVAVDINKYSYTCGLWTAAVLSETNKKQLFIPKGFAHGFLTLSDDAIVLYKTSDYWHPEHEKTIIWNDSHLNIFWPIDGEPIISEKDMKGTPYYENLL